MKASLDESRGDALLERLLAVLLNRWFLAAVAATFLLLVSLELANLLDEGIWEYSAWLWAVHGDPPYVGSFENKPPGIFLLYRLCYAIFGLNLWPVRILGVAAMVGTLLLLYELGRRYQGRIAGAIAALIFGLAMAHDVTDGYMLAVTEPFMVLFTALAFYLLSSVYWRRNCHPERSKGSGVNSAEILRCVRMTGAAQDDRQGNLGVVSWPMLGVGAALGAALSFKQVALADVIGLVPMYWVAAGQNASPRRVFRDVLLMLLAGAAVILLSLVPLMADGATLRDYWNGTWQILLCQTSAIPIGLRLKVIASTWTNPAMAAYYPFVLLYLFQKTRLQRAGIPFWSLLFWLGLAFAGANASHVYKHQLKQVMLPLSLAAGLGIGVLVESTAGFTSRWLLWLYLSVVAALAPFNSAIIGIARYGLPDVMPCPGAEEEQTDRRLAEYIRWHTDPSECIYIWAIYSHPIHLSRSAGRRADTSTRFFVTCRTLRRVRRQTSRRVRQS